MHVTHTGMALLPNPTRPLYLNNVLLTPKIIENRLSVRHFTTDNPVSMEFDPFGLSMKDFPTKAELLWWNSIEDLHPIFSPATPVALTVAKLTALWHQCLGHPAILPSFMIFLVVINRQPLNVCVSLANWANMFVFLFLPVPIPRQPLLF